MNEYFVAHAEAAGNGLVVLPGVVALLQALKVRQPRLFTSGDVRTGSRNCNVEMFNASGPKCPQRRWLRSWQ